MILNSPMVAGTPKAYKENYKFSSAAMSNSPNDVSSTIGFDGNVWHHAQMHGYKSFARNLTDAEKGMYRDFAGRPLRPGLGWVSETSDFPTVLPKITDQQAFQEFRERIGTNLNGEIVPTVSQFEPILTDQFIGIESLLPAPAVEQLRKAHENKTPIQIAFNEESKNWAVDPAFGKHFKPAVSPQTPLVEDVAPVKDPTWVSRTATQAMEFAKDNKKPLIFVTAAVAICAIGYGIHRYNVNKKRQDEARAAQNADVQVMQ